MFLSFNYRHNFVTAYAMYDTQNPAFHGKSDISEGNHGICDNSHIPISGQWYKVEGQDILTNESLVSFFTCGTEVPIWVRLQGQSLLVSQKRNSTEKSRFIISRL